MQTTRHRVEKYLIALCLSWMALAATLQSALLAEGSENISTVAKINALALFGVTILTMTFDIRNCILRAKLEKKGARVDESDPHYKMIQIMQEKLGGQSRFKVYKTRSSVIADASGVTENSILCCESHIVLQSDDSETGTESALEMNITARHEAVHAYYGHAKKISLLMMLGFFSVASVGLSMLFISSRHGFTEFITKSEMSAAIIFGMASNLLLTASTCVYNPLFHLYQLTEHEADYLAYVTADINERELMRNRRLAHKTRIFCCRPEFSYPGPEELATLDPFNSPSNDPLLLEDGEADTESGITYTS